MPVFHEEPCMDCGGCVGVCPHDAIDLRNGLITFRESCTECDLCVRLCPVNAIESVNGLTRTLPERRTNPGSAP